MPALSNNALLVDTLRRHRLLKPAQLDEVANTLQTRFSDPQSLAQELQQRGWLTAFQSRQILLGYGAGLIFGPYVLLERLGEGGSGQVFKARHQTLDRIVALKVLRKELVADPEAVGRFFREVEVISQLSHPAIVHAYDAGVIGAVHFLAMEYVQGIDLDRLVKEKGRLPVGQACDFIRQAALGLQHAHERGLVHRDIKPSNLLVSGGVVSGEWSQNTTHHSPLTTHQVKILDLGLARLQQPARNSRTSHLTVIAGNQVMQGTPDYLAPEQALDFHGADIRADIYSLGCTFYFLLTGQAPFSGGSLTQKLLRHQQAAATPIEDLRPDVPPELPPILARMLAKAPADRYQSPGEVAQALADFKPPPAAPGRSTALVRSTLTQGQVWLGASPARRRRVVAAAGVGLALFVLGVFLFSRGGDGEETKPAVVVKPTEPVKRTVLSFNGATQFVALPDNLLRMATRQTVEVWFKTAGGGVILGYQHTVYPTNPSTYVPVLYVGTDGLLRGEFWNGSSNPITTPGKVNDDRWHYACLVADPDKKLQSLYVDGHLAGTRPGGVDHLNMTGNQVGIGFTGAWPGGNKGWYAFAGTLAELRIWTTVRTPAEIQRDMDKTLTGTEAGLSAYFPLDDATGDVVQDRSSNRWRGTLGGGNPAHFPTRVTVLPFMRPPAPAAPATTKSTP